MSPDGLRVRSYQSGDSEAVIDLWNVVFPGDPPWNEPRSVIERKLGVQPELFLVALLDETVVGTTLAGFDGCRGWVHHVGVAPEARRRGVASLLIAEASQRLRALGCPKLNLQVRGANEAAVRFYANAGFAVEDRVSMSQLLEPESGWPDPK